MRYQTGTPRCFRADTICSASVRGTRGSFIPWTMNRGLVTLSTLLSGAVRSIHSRVVESRSSPYSTRRRSWRYPEVFLRNVARFEIPTTSTEQQIRSS